MITGMNVNELTHICPIPSYKPIMHAALRNSRNELTFAQKGLDKGSKK